MDPARDLPKPLLSDPAKENEPVSVLESETCSTTLADVVSDPDSVLKKLEWSTWLEDTVSELVNVLKIEKCSTEAELKLNEPDMLLARPFISEPVRNSEPVNVLNSEA